MFNRLSTEDKNKIINYIAEYNEIGKEDIDLKKVLDEWAYGKSRLLGDLFGNNLILSKRVSIEKSFEILEKEMYENETIRNTIDEIGKLIEENIEKNIEENESLIRLNHKQWDGYLGCKYALDTAALARNSIDSNFEYKILGTNVVVKGQRGMKPMKLIGKICEALGYDKFEEFRLAHSQILNKKIFTGELCLSIHPLDYMTMSDNDSGWHTCMTWPTGGCYRAGTIEMMNSTNVVVAYLKSSKDMELPDGTSWNNKKWRTLVVVEPDFGITTIKGYPYQEEKLDKIVVEWVKELLIAMGHNNDYIDAPVVRYNYEEINIDFYTEKMYNDFGTINTHCGCFVNAIIKEYEVVDKTIEICYSGPCTCIVCGEEFSGGNTSELTCYNCLETYTCAYCEDIYDEEELIIGENGKRYCPDCYKALTRYNSIITNEPTLRYVMEKVWLLDTEVSNDTINSELYVYARSSEISNQDNWKNLFGCEIHYDGWRYWIDLRQVSNNFDRIVSNIINNKGLYTTFEEVLEKSTIAAATTPEIWY